MRTRIAVLGGLVALSVAGAATAHDGVNHAAHHGAKSGAAAAAQNTPGFPIIGGGDYRLTDQYGHERTSHDPDGHYQMIFFGYASCKAICSVALPHMAQAADILAGRGIEVTPLLITVDPERDTVAAMREAVPEIHPRLIGLTGSEAALDEAYKAFSVEKKLVYVHPDEGPIYAHGTFIYLTGPDGAFKTLMPPVLAPERMAEIIASYAGGAATN